VGIDLNLREGVDIRIAVVSVGGLQLSRCQALNRACRACG